MLLRAVLVLLAVINLGVAAWWAARPPAPTAVAAALPAGVPRLQLLREAPRPLPVRPPAPVATAAQCFSFGPYATPAALRRAHARVQPQALRVQVREEAVGTAEGWRVFLPPMASAQDAQATAARIAAAGLTDVFVIPAGADANGIALGRFRGEDAARRRQAALQAAGFAAQVAPLGAAATRGWLDVAAAAGVDGARIAQEIGASQLLPLDCTRVP